MRPQTSSVDYALLTKRAFLVGVVLFAIGLLGEAGIHAVGFSVPAWEETLLFDAEIAGIAIMLFSPFVFGILLPLVD
jgi:nitrate reductase gamma subunit